MKNEETVFDVSQFKCIVIANKIYTAKLLNSSFFTLSSSLKPFYLTQFFTASPTVLMPVTIIMRLPATSFRLHVRGL